jgi:hypothetical protein
MKLNSESKLAIQPSGFLLDLKKHQLAMLNVATIVETKSKFGFLTDKAGTGKTAIILALVLRDLELGIKPQTVVVVPQNIHTQWLTEIEKMIGDKATVYSLIDYQSVSSLMFDDSVLDNDIILTTTSYYEMVYNCIKQNDKNIRRLVYDEIDSMKDIFKSQKAKKEVSSNTGIIPGNFYEGNSGANITWFISASIDNIVGESEDLSISDYSITKSNLNDYSIECETEFVKSSSQQLQEPKITDIKCVSAIEKFTNYLSIDQLDALNSMNFKKILGATTEKEIITLIVKEYLTNIQRCNTNLAPKQKVLGNKKLDQKVRRAIEKEVNDLSKEKKFYEAIVALIFEKNELEFNSDEKESYQHFLQSFEKFDNITITKMSALEKIIKELSENKKKTLVFSDYEGSFDIVKKLAEKYEIKNEELQGGNVKAISKSIDNYKNGDTQLLLLDSENNSRGMNLENTGTIVFIHKTKEYMYNQITGRAQRPGRTEQLEIISLINENEAMHVNSSD